MITIVAAAALAAQPVAPAPTAATTGHEMHMQAGQAAEHKGCCKNCCKDMEAKMEGHHPERGE